MSDLSKLINLKNIIIVALVITVFFLLTCNKKADTPPPPATTSVPVQQDRVRTDSIMSQHEKDSVQKVTDYWIRSSARHQNDWQVAANEVNILQNGMNDILTQPVPDTCKAFQAQIQGQFYKLLSSSRLKDSASISQLRDKDSIIVQKDAMIAIGKEDYRKLRANLDTCFKQQITLEKYVNKINPKRQIFAGGVMLGNQVQYLNGYGVSLGLRNKKGTIYEVGVIQIGSTTNYSVSVKKPLFNF